MGDVGVTQRFVNKINVCRLSHVDGLGHACHMTGHFKSRLFVCIVFCMAGPGKKRKRGVWSGNKQKLVKEFCRYSYSCPEMAWLWSCLWLDRSAAKYVTSAPRHLYSSPHIQPPRRTRVSETSILRPSGDFLPSRQLRQECNSIIQEARKSRVCIIVCSSVWWRTRSSWPRGHFGRVTLLPLSGFFRLHIQLEWG